MTDLLTDPEALRRELIRLFAEPKNLRHIVAAGLDGVRRQLAELRDAIEGAENGAAQVVTTVAELANLVRQEQRKHAGAVAQAKKEHARADQLAAEVEQLRQAVTGAQQEAATTARVSRQCVLAAEREVKRLRGELADYRLAASEHQGAGQRDQDQWARAAVAKIYAYFGTPGILGDYGEGGRKAAELIAPPAVLAEFGAAPVLCGATIDGLTSGLPLGPCIRPALPQHDLHEAADGTGWGNIRLTRPAPEQPVPATFQREPRLRAQDVATAVGFVDLRAQAMEQLRQAQAEEAARVDRVLLGVETPSRFAAVTCWCEHLEQSHVTDGADNAVCRACVREQTTLHQAFHVHAPEQP